jgi:hypothetical protein
MGQMFQTFVVATQNAVPRSHLGIATASIQFFRTIGATFGTAVYGAVLTRRFTSELTARLGAAADGLKPGALLSGAVGVTDLSPPILEGVRDALARALHTVFAAGLPVMGIVLVAALLLRELPLRTVSYVEEVSGGSTKSPRP